MKQKSWHLNRRTVLKSAGVCLALPWLECMASDRMAAPRKRFFAGYFAYGVPMPADDAPDRLDHGWFPLGEGRDYEAPAMHDSIMPLRDKVIRSVVRRPPGTTTRTAKRRKQGRGVHSHAYGYLDSVPGKTTSRRICSQNLTATMDSWIVAPS